MPRFVLRSIWIICRSPALLALASFAFLVSAAAAELNRQPTPEWIWAVPEAKDNQVAFFRKTFEAQPGVLKAILLGACDNKMIVFLNGQRVAEIENYARAASVDVTKHLRPGKNVLAVQAQNFTGPAALGVVLELVADLGQRQWLISDRTWQASLVETKDWQQPGFTPKDWTPAFSHGLAGREPWGNPFDPAKVVDAYNSWKLALGAQAATDAATVQVPPGFKAELVRSAQPEEGSWVSMAFDPQGRLTLAREKRGLLRLTLSQSGDPKVEVINDTLLECRGLLYAFGSLYVNANNSQGFYRLRDTQGSGQFDEVKELLHTEGGVGHGRNHIVAGPDNMIYLVHGNNVLLPKNISAQSPLRNYRDDQLIPCPWDPQLFDGDCLLPAGHVLRTDPDGKSFELFAGGFRNPFDVAFNPDGEMFTFDADMEWDVGTPWYRPNRVNHVVSGSDYGWRRGTGKWPDYFPDTLPSTLDIGLASPTGIEFGTRSQFPPKYQRALFISDWAYGRIIAVHLKPQGASYTATSELFATGRPLNVTDVTFGPDGAMYFITGGRGTQSGLYRVSYTGPKISEPQKSKTELAQEKQAAELRALRRRLEAYHRGDHQEERATIVDIVWPHLGHADPWIRHAARIALEYQPVDVWQAKALAETQAGPALTALLALARCGGKELQPDLFARLNRLPFAELNESQQLQAVRTYELAFVRMGKADAATRSALAGRLDALYPAPSRWVNHQLCELLVYLQSPTVIAKTTRLLAQAEAPEDLVKYLFFLRYLPDGWTLEQRRIYFHALARAEKIPGARDYVRSLQTIRNEVIAALSPAERVALATVLEEKPKPAITAPTLAFVKNWQLEDLLPSLEKVARGRSFSSGKAAFVSAQCVACHRLGNDPDISGGVLGPDLTAVASRFNRRDLLDSIINPSKVIDEKFRNTTFTLKNGDTISGGIEREDAKQVHVRTNPFTAQTTVVSKGDISQRQLSLISPMPTGLLDILQLDQVLDLLAYLESGGNPKHAAFKP